MKTNIIIPFLIVFGWHLQYVTIESPLFKIDISAKNNCIEHNAFYDILNYPDSNLNDMVGNFDSCETSGLRFDSIVVYAINCHREFSSIIIWAEGGTGQLTYSMDGIQYQNFSTFNYLMEGIYEIWVMDEAGCIIKKTVEVLKYLPPIITDIETLNTTCGEDNGFFRIEAESFGSMRYAINGMNFQDDNEFDFLEAGTYEVIVRDIMNCRDTIEVTIEDSPSLQLEVLDRQLANCLEDDGFLSLETTGGTGVLSLYVNDEYEQRRELDDLAANIYHLLLQDGVGCTLEETINLRQEKCPLFIPNVFSPNDDGVNDVFKIYPPDGFEAMYRSMKIFDRYGSFLFHAEDFDVHEVEWNGTYRGKKLSTGVYVYIIEVEYVNGERELFSGDVSIIR